MNDQAMGQPKRYDEAFKRQAVEHWFFIGADIAGNRSALLYTVIES